MSKGKIVIGLTGMPGAGKSTVNQIFSEQGYPTIVMGDFVRKEAKKLGLKATRKNLSMLMIYIRQKRGPAALAKCTISEVKKLNSPIVLIDGIRNIAEVEEFQNHFSDFRLIAIHSPSKLRFKRLLKRRRKDDPTSWESFTKRDYKEANVGLSGVIGIADKVIENVGSLKDFKIKVKRFLENL